MIWEKLSVTDRKWLYFNSIFNQTCQNWFCWQADQYCRWAGWLVLLRVCDRWHSEDRIKGFTAELCTVARLSVLITSATGRVNAKRQLCPFGYSRSSFHPGGGLAAWFQISAVSLLKCPLARHYIYPKLFPMLCHQCFNVWMISHTTLPPLYECVVSDLRRLERLL